MRFKGEPGLLVRLNPPIGTIHFIRFNDKGYLETENERLIKRLNHRFHSAPKRRMKEEQ